MSIVRYVNNQWTEPVPVFNDHWEIAGCPVNGPSLSSLNNALVMGWFTAADGKPKVNLIFSSNSGNTFSQPIQVDQGNPLGRVKVALIEPQTAFISWMEGSQIVAAKVESSGIISHNKIVIAWVDTESKKVKTGILIL